MNIGCVTIYNAKEKKSFGGRGYYMCEAIKKRVDNFEYLGPIQQFKLYSVYFKGLEYYYNHVRHRMYTRNKDRWLFQYYGNRLGSYLKIHPLDIIFSPTSPGSQPIAYLETDKPIVMWTDTTFYAVLDFYPEWNSQNLSHKIIHDGLKNEEQALQRSSLVVFKSDWAARIAIKTYGIDPSKVMVAPGGPGFDFDIRSEDVQKWIDQRSRKKCKLVFIGGNWERKGGPTAYEVVKKLNKMGIDTELITIGCQPKIDSRDDHIVTSMGHVEKNTQNGFARFSQIMKDAHFFIMPSRAEAMGIANIEANAFGLPALTTDVGGIPTVVKNDVNGRTFHLEENIDTYCNYIAEYFHDFDKYRDFAYSSFLEYKKRLTWDVSADRVVTAMHKLLPKLP